MFIPRHLVLISFFLFLTSSASGQEAPVVTSTFPVAQALTVDRNTSVTVTFDTALDPASVTPLSFRVFGRWSGPASGTLQLENDQTRIRFTPTEPFFAGEWVTVAVSRNVKSVEGVSMGRPYTCNFWIKTQPGTLDLKEVARIPIRRPNEGRIQSYGAYAGDLNNDGWTDLAIPNEQANDVRVFLNDGAGHYTDFTIFPLPGGSVPSTNEGADFNRDGEIDLAVGNIGNNHVSLLLGNGQGGFLPERTYKADEEIRGLGVIDLNGDGADDIITANRNGDNLSLLSNKGNGTFLQAVNMEADATGETACAVADANGDGIQDVFVGAFSSREIVLLLGDGEGGLHFSSKVRAGGRAWMLAVGDVNGDGLVDVVSANSLSNSFAVILGDGLGGLQDAVVYEAGQFALAIDLGDLDGDGDLDVITSNFSSGDWTLYENAGNGVFINPKTYRASSAGSCAVFHDRDNDGDLDISAIDEIDDLLFLFENDPSAVDVQEQPVPGQFQLQQNYPNPFNPSTTIEYRLSNPAHVLLKIYNLQGEEIQILVDERQATGTKRVIWDGRNRSGQVVSSGLYIYQVRVGQFTQSRKMLFLK